MSGSSGLCAAALEIENLDVKVGAARKGKPVRKAGTQSHRSKGCKPYDSGITEAAPSCWRFPPLASAFRFPRPLSEACTPFYFPLAPLQVPQQQVERVRRQLDLAERQAQRNQQQKQRAAEDQLRALLPADINDHHAQHAQEQAADAQRLHVADQAHAQAQALDLA